MLKRVGKVLLLLIIGLSLLAWSLIGRINKSKEEGAIAHVPIDTLVAENRVELAIEVGWSKVHIIPEFPVRMVGYGIHDNYDGILDSLFVRAIVFRSKEGLSLLLNHELLIMHPDLKDAIKQGIEHVYPHVNHVFYSVTHTHTSYGEWANEIAGNIFFGGYNEELVNFIVGQTKQAVAEALGHMSSVDVAYQEIEMKGFVSSRIVKKGPTDDFLRMLMLKNRQGEICALPVFSAHPTNLNYRETRLYGDYPSVFTQKLEQDSSIEMAIFIAGMVGSHRCSPILDSIADVDQYATVLADTILSQLDSLSYATLSSLCAFDCPINIGSPVLKINQEYMLRPWIFDLIIGKRKPYISVLQLNENVLMGTPADFSGELMKDLSATITVRDLHLMVTSFNGEYIGYVIPERHYDLSKDEATIMNWYGPKTGSCFVKEMTNILNEL